MKEQPNRLKFLIKYTRRSEVMDLLHPEQVLYIAARRTQLTVLGNQWMTISQAVRAVYRKERKLGNLRPRLVSIVVFDRYRQGLDPIILWMRHQ